MARIAIIGAGFQGLACAFHLMADGHDVTVFDPGGVASGASFGNMGTFANYACIPVNNPSVFRDAPRYLFSAQSPFRLRLGYLPQLLPWLALFLRASLPGRSRRSAGDLAGLLARAGEGYRSILAEPILRDFVRPAEALYLYGSEAAFAKAQADLDFRAREGVPFETLAPGALRDLEPGLAPIFARGVLFRGSWHLTDPAGFLRALAGLLAVRGLRLEPLAVEAIRPKDASVTLLVGGTERSFDGVVLAAGARARSLARQCGDDVPLDTERGYHVVFAGGRDLLSRPCGWAERGFYMTPMQDGLRVGGTVELGGFTDERSQPLLDLLAYSAKRAVPGLGEAGSPWLGFRPTLPDGLPVIGRATASRRVIYAFGHQHLGLTLAGLTGQVVADLWADRAPDLDLACCAPDRFARAA